MTTILKATAIFLMIFSFSILTFSNETHQIAGTWKGKFMDQFDLELIFKVNEENQLSGRIYLFDGEQQIQDDPLSEIRISGDQLYFRIPSKNTEFEGIWRIAQNEIEGNFIFPDQSIHALRISRSCETNNQVTDQKSNGLALLDQHFTCEQLKEDLNFLKKNLEAYHPQLYLFCEEEQMNRIFTEVNDRIREGLTAGEFYHWIAPVIEKVNCSHTGIRLSEKCREACRESGSFVPLQIYFSGDQAYCLGSYSPYESIPAGSILHSINGKNLDEIRKTIFSWIPTDGNNVSAKYFEINRHFIYYYQILDNSERFIVEYQAPESGEISNIRISGRTMIEIGEDERYIQRNGVEDPVSFSIRDEINTGILKMGSFAIPDLDSYLNKMDQVFTAIRQKNIQNLILDLRGNQGGHPFFAAVLLSYLAQEPFTYFDDTDRVEEFGPLYEPMPPSEKTFQGDCYVLVDGGVLSTAGHLVSLIKYHNLGQFVGEEPGSSFYCNDMSKRIRFPNTKIEVNIPQKTFMASVSGFKADAPFVIDFPAYMEVSDLTNGVDSQMEFTSQLIVSKNK